MVRPLGVSMVRLAVGEVGGRWLASVEHGPEFRPRKCRLRARGSEPRRSQSLRGRCRLTHPPVSKAMAVHTVTNAVNGGARQTNQPVHVPGSETGWDEFVHNAVCARGRFP